MKNLEQIILVFMLFITTGAISQTYEIRRTDNQRTGINYGNTIPTTDLAGYIGGVQSQMQAKYDYNYQKISDKLDDIGFIIKRLNKEGVISSDSRRAYVTSYYGNLSKIDRINFTDNVTVTKVMSYLRSIEDELNTW